MINKHKGNVLTVVIRQVCRFGYLYARYIFRGKQACCVWRKVVQCEVNEFAQLLGGIFIPLALCSMSHRVKAQSKITARKAATLKQPVVYCNKAEPMITLGSSSCNILNAGNLFLSFFFFNVPGYIV